MLAYSQHMLAYTSICKYMLASDGVASMLWLDVVYRIVIILSDKSAAKPSNVVA